MSKYQEISPNYLAILSQIAVVFILNITATALSFVIQQLGFTEVNIVVVYILAVLLTSYFTQGYLYGAVASIVATLSFNFFFTEPVHTFTVNDKSYIFTFVVMLLAAMFTGALTAKLIHSKEKATAQEEQTNILYKITSSLAKTSGVTDVVNVAMQCLSNLFACEVISILIGESKNKLCKITLSLDKHLTSNYELALEELPAFTTDYSTHPIKVQNKTVCIICLPKTHEIIHQEKLVLLDSILMQITIAMERELLTKEKESAMIETEQERFKSNLLRAISHDLRTPLSGITGAAEMLIHNIEDSESAKIAVGIYEDSIWLIRLVENILSLTRIQEGRLNVITQCEAVEEIVSEAIIRVHKYSPDHQIKTAIPDQVIFIKVDGKLIIQVLINLLDNAIKHTAAEKEILLSVTEENEKIWFEVDDNGTGIDENELPRLFDSFHVASGSRTDSKRGIGLGLAICKAIVNMHGGEIYAENKSSGGAVFRFFLNR
jgi:two-component system sensor histidine kinase KdpD